MYNFVCVCVIEKIVNIFTAKFIKNKQEKTTQVAAKSHLLINSFNISKYALFLNIILSFCS